SVKFSSRRRLFCPDAADHDLGARIIFALHFRAGESAKHRELADVRERVGDGALKEALRRYRERSIRREVLVEASKRLEESLALAIPFERRGIGPRFGAFGLRPRPVVQVA